LRGLKLLRGRARAENSDMKRWTVVLAGFLVVLGPGAIYSFSLLSQPLAAAFGWVPSDVTWAFALANFFFAVGALAGGVISDRFGVRLVAAAGVVMWAAGYALCGTLTWSHSIFMLYLFYGVIAGFGCGVAYIAALAAAIRWFSGARGLGGGFVMMGFGLGSFVYSAAVRHWPPFASITSAAQSYGAGLTAANAAHVPFDPAPFLMPQAAVAQLMSLFLFSGAAFAVVCGFVTLLLAVPPAEEAGTAPRGRQFTLAQMLGDARFYIIWAMLFLNIFGGVTMISNIVPIMHELTAMPIADAAGVYGFLAILNGLGRLFWGALSDRIGRRWTFATLFGGQALAFFALDADHDAIVVVVAIALLLFCYGGGFGTMPAYNADFYGTKHFGANYGAQMSAFGLAAVFGTYFISTMRELSGSFAGLMQPISIVLLIAIFFPLITESPNRAGATSEPSPAM
jgi:MFS family permease